MGVPRGQSFNPCDALAVFHLDRRPSCERAVGCHERSPSTGLDEVGRVAMDGTVTSFPVPNHFHGSYPDTLEGIATGAGNDMWFTEEAANRIGRIRTS